MFLPLITVLESVYQNMPLPKEVIQDDLCCPRCGNYPKKIPGGSYVDTVLDVPLKLKLLFKITIGIKVRLQNCEREQCRFLRLTLFSDGGKKDG